MASRLFWPEDSLSRRQQLDENKGDFVIVDVGKRRAWEITPRGATLESVLEPRVLPRETAPKWTKRPATGHVGLVGVLARS